MSNKPMTSEESAKLLEDSGDSSRLSDKWWFPLMLLAFLVAAGGVAFLISIIVTVDLEDTGTADMGGRMVDDALAEAEAPFACTHGRMDILDAAGGRLGYSSLTFLWVDVAAGELPTEVVVAEYLDVVEDSPRLIEGLDPYDLAYFSSCDDRWRGSG